VSEMSRTTTEETEIGALSAVWHAFTRSSITHFPRVRCPCGSWATVPDAELIGKAATALKDLVPDNGDDLDAALGHARETLDEVKALTEYQDGKATRLLAIITFLSALAGVLFGKLADLYPLHSLLARFGGSSWQAWLVYAAYGLFAAFVLLAVCGAMVTFHALRARFRYPKTLDRSRAKSFLFYLGILEVSPEDWAGSYVTADDRTKISGDINLRYFQSYVVESYLIAAKVADKVRYLVPAQAMLAFATRVLVLWFLVYAITFVLVPPLDRQAYAIPAPAAAVSAPSPSSPRQ
jgi:hypothetical protein